MKGSKIRVSIIGAGGHMSANILRRIENSGFNPEIIIGYEKDNAKLLALCSEFPECKIADTAAEAIADSDIVILAIRPQDLSDLAEELNGCIFKGPKAVISIVTAKTMEKLHQTIQGICVIRCSTNILLETGSGASFWIADPKTPSHLLEACKKIISSWGYNREVNSEKETDLAIVDSGCMPAIICYPLDAIIQAMVARSRSEEEATELTLSIAENTIKRMRQKNLRPAQVVAEVKTPGGITASALEIFDSVNLMEIIHEALSAADQRVRELI